MWNSHRFWQESDWQKWEVVCPWANKLLWEQPQELYERKSRPVKRVLWKKRCEPELGESWLHDEVHSRAKYQRSGHANEAKSCKQKTRRREEQKQTSCCSPSKLQPRGDVEGIETPPVLSGKRSLWGFILLCKEGKIRHFNAVPANFWLSKLSRPSF